MKSKTVKWNLFTLLTTIMLVLGYFTSLKNIPQWLFLVMVVINWISSQAITFFTPSGEFVGSGQNWTWQKWLLRIGTSVMAIFSLMEGSGIGAATAALLSPVLEIIIRMYGSDTSEQRVANRIAAARGQG